VADLLAYPLTKARSRLGELVSRARFCRERHARDAADLALCARVTAEGGAGLPHDDFMALLEAEDAEPR